MIRNFLRYAALASIVSLGACDLAIENPNSGETRRVLGSPDDAEALISTYYKRWSTGVYSSITDLQGMANVMSLMNYSSLANSCQNSHLPFAGASNVNSPGNTCAGEQVRLYKYSNEVARVASNLLEQMDSGALKLGPSDQTTDVRALRARAWAEFLRGISLGYLAMMHDSSSIVSPNMVKTEPDCVDQGGVCAGALRPYNVVMDSALAALTRSIAYTNTPNMTGTGVFQIPDTWLPSPTSWTAANFTQLVRSYRARFRANVAHTPAARAAVDWAAVVADAQNGITADHLITTSTTVGPRYDGWREAYDTYTTWHQMPPFFIGMADNSGRYAAWINTPLGDRGAGNTGFFMVTPDLRFPQGATRVAQQADFAITSCETPATECKRYFVNRTTSTDQFSGFGWGWSNYDHVRFHSWRVKGASGSGRNGPTVFFALEELDLLQAEGLYRQNDFAGAAALINKSRTRGMVGGVATGGGLPPVTAANATTPVAGGADCVPKVPRPDGSVVCGDLWEALKYEKRIETAYTTYSPWFLDGRGWGDLPKDTPLFWPVPYDDLQARGRPISALYGTGPGAGNAPNSTAAGSSYGW
ncbi:MAG: hypothetical protein ABIR92_01730 [Gemmatimonadaceae bacterium]